MQKADRKYVGGECVCVCGDIVGAGVVSMINVMILIIHLLTASFSHSYY